MSRESLTVEELEQVEAMIDAGRWLYEQFNMMVLESGPPGYGNVRLSHKSLAQAGHGKLFPGAEWRPMSDGACRFAFDEGWGLFFDTGLGAFRIEADIDAGLIADDDAALRLVAQRASYGSSVHLAALSQHGT